MKLKNFIFTIILIIYFSQQIYSQNLVNIPMLPLDKNYKTIYAPITAAQIYQNKAILIRTANINITKGENHFIIINLTKDILPNTLLVYKANENDKFIIKDFEIKTVKNKFILNKKEQELKKQLDKLKKELQKNIDKVEIIDNEIKFYKNIAATTTTEISKNLTFKDVKIKNSSNIINFISIQLEKKFKTKRKLEEKIKKLKDEIAIIESNLSKIIKKNLQKVKILYIRIFSNQNLKSKIFIKYLISKAYWQPYYEINYNSKKEKVEVKCYAKIVQTTSEKWTNIKISLLTGSPLFDVTLPKPTPWIIRKYKPYTAYYKKGKPRFSKSLPKQISTAQESASQISPQEYEMPKRITGIKSQEVNIKINLAGKFDILNTIEGKKILYKELKFNKSEVFYTAVPSKNQMAYLTVKFANTSDMILLKGNAALYLNNNYTGKGRIKNNLRINEKIKFSFGIDENIKIQKKLLFKKAGKKGIIKNKKMMNYGYEIKVENYKNKKITLYIEEPLPFSQDEDIKVELYDNSPKYHERKENGIYVWKLKLNPQEKIRIIYKFKIVYPEDVEIWGLR